MATQIVGVERLVKDIQRFAPAILQDLGRSVLYEAEEIAAIASATVPVDTGLLSSGAFVDGPKTTNTPKKKSVTATTGYDDSGTREGADDPYVAAEHEGWHWQTKGPGRTQPPPRWLKHASENREKPFAVQVGRQIMATLSKFRKP